MKARRIIAILLVCLMTLSEVPFGAFAAEVDLPVADTYYENIQGIPEKPEVTVQENVLTYQTWDGTVAESLTGEGTAENPYLISDGGQLKYFANQVNEGNSYAGDYIKLDDNIDLANLTWEPIGIKAARPFSGHFDGNGHELTNVNITHDAGDGYDITEDYIGFFGYVKDATIQNLGIGAYKIDKQYDVDTTMGGFVAYTENSTVVNCYADGDICANFVERFYDFSAAPTIVPRGKTREVKLKILLYTYTYEVASFVIDGFPDSSVENGLIIDFSSLTPPTGVAGWDVSNISIPKEITSVKFIGNPQKAYSGIKITIEDNDTHSCYLEFENFHTTSGSIVCNGDRDIYIKSSGTGNSITNGDTILFTETGLSYAPVGVTYVPVSSYTIDGADNAIYFLGTTPLKICGDTGNTGGTGGTAMNAAKLVVGCRSDVTIRGGNGGTGSTGSKGDDGKSYPQTHDDRNATDNGASGGNGAAGEDGGDGGAGGVPLANDTEIISYGTLTLKGGDGGKGGKGGNGGAGGQGQESGGWGCTGGRGGDGGDGGKGGNSGTPGSPGEFSNARVAGDYGTISVVNGATGAAGAGGDGGAEGAGGTHSNIRDSGTYFFTWGYEGSSGTPGKPGDPGSVTQPQGSEYCIDEDVTGTPPDVPQAPYRLAATALVAGGFAGYVDENSTIELCAATVNDIYNNADGVLDSMYDTNSKTTGNLVGKAAGTVRNCYATTKTDNGYSKYDVSTWFAGGNSNDADVNAVIVADVTDSQGVTYDYVDGYGIVYNAQIAEDNRVAWNRTAVTKLGKAATDVVIPAYIYNGKFICAVTELADDLFYGCTELKSVDLGDNVETLGVNILYACRNLKTITIGPKVTEIPELKDSKPLFGLGKDTSSLRSYFVDDGNPVFGSVDGVLYELFNLDVPVAIVDVPVEVEITNFQPQAHVVRIYANAFSYNRTIESVKLDYIREVGDAAFFGAVNLETVEFGTYEPAEEEYITILAQQYAAASEQYTQTIGIAAFQDCKFLSKVNLESEFIRMIGSNAFANCATGTGTNPLEITLGKKISVISATDDELRNGQMNSYDQNMVKNFAACFEGSNIVSFDVVEGNPRYTAMDGVLYFIPEEGSQERWLIIYPNRKTDTEFTVPALSDATVNRIAVGAFGGAEYLQQLTIDNGVQMVCDRAFENAKLYGIFVGSQVKALGHSGDIVSVFRDCTNLSHIDVAEDNGTYTSYEGVLYNKDMTRLIKYPQAKTGKEFTAPETVDTIAEEAMFANPFIRRVTFVSEIQSVGMRAFNGSSNLSIIYFTTGAAPFTSQNAVKESFAFVTNNSRVMVCYGSDDESWKNLDAVYYSKDNTPVRLYSIEKFAGYPEDKSTTGYYAFVVVDKAGNPLNDVYVELGGNKADIGGSNPETIKTQAGIAMFYNLEYGVPYQLRVIDNQGEYYPVINEEFYLDEATRITYITLSSVPVVSGISVKYDNDAADAMKKTDLLGGVVADYIYTIGGKTQVVDINSQTAKINRWSVKFMELQVSVGMDEGFRILGYHLLQGQKILHTGEITDETGEIQQLPMDASYKNKQFFKITTSVTTDKLENEEDIYIVVEFVNDKGVAEQIQTKLNLHIFTLDWYPLDVSWATNEIKINIDENIPFLGGGEIKLAEKGKKPLVKVAFGNDFFRVTVGGKVEEEKFGDNYEKNQSDTFKEAANNWSQYLDDLKSGKKSKYSTFEDEQENKIGVNLEGYLEVKYKGLTADGNPDMAYTGAMIGTIKYTYSVGTTTMIWIIPVRLEVEFTLEGKSTWKLTLDKEAEQFLTPDVSFRLKGEVEAYAGVGCKLASVGIYGSITTVLLVDIIPQFKLNKWTFSGDIGAYVKYDGLFVKFKKTWSLFEALGWNTEWVIYENGKWWYQQDEQTVSVQSMEAMYNLSNYEIAVSEYDESIPKSLSGLDQQDAYAQINPKYLRVGSKIYIVYHTDLNGYSSKYDAYNYQKLVYQIYDMDEKNLSDVRILDDNGYADGAFDLYYDGTNGVIVYSQLNTRLTSDDLEDMEGYVSAMEVKTARLVEGAFVAEEDTLTHDDFYDMNLRVGQVDGKITAVWIRNTKKSIQGLADSQNPSAIMYSSFDGTEWSDPDVLKGDLGTITDMEIGNGQVAYITDTNNNLMTNSSDSNAKYADRIITTIDFAGNILTTSAQENAYHDIAFVDGQWVYYLANNLYTLDGTALLDAPVAQLPESYTVLTDAQGKPKAIVYVGNTEEEESEAKSSNLFAIFCNDGQWGQPVQLTDYSDGTFVSAFAAEDDGDEMVLSVLLSQLYIDNSDKDEYVDYATKNSFITQRLAYPTGYTMNGVQVDPNAATPNSPATMRIWITNNGYQTLESVPVSVGTYSDTVSTFYNQNGEEIDGLISGATGYVEIFFNPGQPTVNPYTVEMNGQQQEVKLWYADAAVFGKQVKIGSGNFIVAYVTNMGHLSVDCGLDIVYQGETLDTLYLSEPLDYGEVQYFTVALDEEFVQNQTEMVKLVLNVQGEYSVTNNEAQVAITMAEELEIAMDSMYVWLSQTSAKVNRSTLEDFAVYFDDGYTLLGVKIGQDSYTAADGLYTLNGNTVTFSAQFLTAAYADGVYDMFLQFDGDMADSPIELTITRNYPVIWDVDGNQEQVWYEAGTVPQYPVPEKPSDGKYIYTFAGWDSNADGIADSVMAVDGEVTYTALFDAELCSYTVQWIVDGVTVTETYSYGQLPQFSGSTDRASDDKYNYTFIGWDTEIVPCTADAVYVAQYEATLRLNPTITLSYPTLSFESEIRYNIYFTAKDMEQAALEDMGLLVFQTKNQAGTIDTAAQIIPGAMYSNGVYMVHTNGIPAKMLGDAVYFKVYAKLSDGSYVYSDVAGYNAVAYAKTVLSSSTSSKKAKALMVAMLNYGAASQEFFNYKTDSLMNSFLSEAGKALVADYDESMVDPVVPADSAHGGHFVMNKTAFTNIYPTVSFEGAFSINYYLTTGLTPDSGITFCYWDAETYAKVDKLTTSNATGIMKMQQDGDRWYAAVDGIAAKDMDQTVYIAAIYKSGGTAYTTSVIAYSLGKYCATIAARGDTFGAAAAVYGYYAKAYFAS